MGAIRPGWLLTTIPSSDAASRSIMSVPIEHVEIIRRSGSDSSAGRNHLTAPLVLMMTSAFSTRRSCSSIEAGRSLYSTTSPYGSSRSRCGESCIWIGSSPGTTNFIRPFSAMTLTSQQSGYGPAVGMDARPDTGRRPRSPESNRLPKNCRPEQREACPEPVEWGPGEGSPRPGRCVDLATAPKPPHSVRRDTRRVTELVGPRSVTIAWGCGRDSRRRP